MRRGVRVLAVLTWLAAGSLPVRAGDCTGLDAAYHRLGTAEAEIAYRWEPAEIRLGQFFSAEVIACRARGEAEVSEIAVDAVMPAHGHGMNYRPEATRVGAGRFRVTGLMLHMPGLWRLSFDLYQGARRTRLTRDLMLKP